MNKFKIGDIIEDDVTIDRIIGIDSSSYKVINLVNLTEDKENWIPGREYNYQKSSVDKDAHIAYSYIWNKELKEIINED